MQFSNVIAGLALATLATGSALAQPSPPAPPLPATPHPAAARDATRDGTIEHVLLSPRGDVDGVVLRDGTAVRFPPHAVAGAPQIRVGTNVHVAGAQVTGTDGATLFDARVTVGGTVVADAGAPPPPPAPPRPLDANGPALASLTVTGRVIRILTNREGIGDAALLDDGTVVYVGPGDALGRAGIVKGAQLTATGRGGAYPLGRSIDADTLKVGARAPITVDRPAPPRPPAP